MAKKKEEEKELPLINTLKEFNRPNLFSQFKLPEYIKDNLKHTLRAYQEQALSNLNWTQHRPEVNTQYNHLLFQMATGSGKTDVMAAIILYMYKEFGYHNFLFVVNTNAVVSKTYENLLNSVSEKYLFSDPIYINGQPIEIRSVSQYPSYPESGVIYLRLTTIQTLSNELNSPRENGLTYNELAKDKLVVLADEAHHFSSSTKKEEKENNSWEALLNRVLESNYENRQFEFTATLDLHNDDIYNKYKNKILYRYDLSEFVYQGYSKKVYRLQANNNDNSKMLNAVLLSQYRKLIANDLNIPDFKPIILFKSNLKKTSKAAEKAFSEMIAKLDVDSLHQFILEQDHTSKSKALKQVYEYWLNKSQDNLAGLIVQIQKDFSPMNLINVNDSGSKNIMEANNNYHNLNTLESPDNPFRAIFAVAKLSEGWDVLNLYDIVRIGEQSTTLKQTNSEAQLIGRGARYNPFIYEGKRSFTRRFDKKDENYQLLESLYYHTINEPKYLEHLKESLDSINLPVQDDSNYDIYSAEVKPKFAQSRVYKYGNIYYNEIEDVPDNDFSNLSQYGVDLNTIHQVNLVDSTSESEMNADSDEDIATEQRLLFSNKTLGSNEAKRFVIKAMSRNPFYRFKFLREYLPTLHSLEDFRTSDKWLGKVRVAAEVAANADDLSAQKQLKVVEKILYSIQVKIVNNYRRQRGTNRFKALPIRNVIRDYQKRVGRQFSNRKYEAFIRPYDMSSSSWFVFDNAIVDGLEYSLIRLIRNFINNLENKYDRVYLLRIDEQNTDFKLHQFQGSPMHYAGYMPDFILYLQDNDFCYQVYIEPKGDQLLFKDAWKQELLESIRPDNVKIVGENDQVKLYGVKFYLKGDRNNLGGELNDDGLI